MNKVIDLPNLQYEVYNSNFSGCLYQLPPAPHHIIQSRERLTTYISTRVIGAAADLRNWITIIFLHISRIRGCTNTLVYFQLMPDVRESRALQTVKIAFTAG